METLLDKEMFNIENMEFYENYFELLINRVTHATMELESDLGNPNNSKNTIRLKDNMEAFKYLIKNMFRGKELDTEIIIRTANKINASMPFVLNGYRNTGAPTIVDSEVPISKPETIERDMEYLVENYNTIWALEDPYVREALFHICFIRIHPFEDGNGRTGRLIMNYNLLKQGLAPVILTKEIESIYHEFIKNFDEEAMAELFRSQSLKEKEIVDKLFQEYKNEKKTL